MVEMASNFGCERIVGYALDLDARLAVDAVEGIACPVVAADEGRTGAVAVIGVDDLGVEHRRHVRSRFNGGLCAEANPQIRPKQR